MSSEMILWETRQKQACIWFLKETIIDLKINFANYGTDLHFLIDIFQEIFKRKYCYIKLFSNKVYFC